MLAFGFPQNTTGGLLGERLMFDPSINLPMRTMLLFTLLIFTKVCVCVCVLMQSITDAV